jgi:hypothetical protein
MDLDKHLVKIKSIKGFMGVGVFTATGEFLAGNANISGIHQELAGAGINDALLHVQEITEELGMGRANMVQIDAGVGKIVAKCHNKGGVHFHTVVYIAPDGNVAMAKLLLEKVIVNLAGEF